MTVDIKPFERRCICPTPPPTPADHTAACKANHREEFMAYTAAFQRAFYCKPGH